MTVVVRYGLYFMVLFQISCLKSDLVNKDEFHRLQNEMKEIQDMLSVLMTELREQRELIQGIVETRNLVSLTAEGSEESERSALNDTAIEERVTILEFQVSGLTEEVIDLGDEVDVIDGEIAVIFTGQVIQDGRILELEADSEIYEDSISNLDEALSAVDGRLTAVNFTLSGEIQDVDTGLTALGDSVAELEGRMENLESELTSIEELISELEGRLTTLEVVVAFEADLDEYTSILIDSYVIFDQILLNIGDGYNSTTGTFTVPPGGDGLYFLYINFFVQDQEGADFVIVKNGGEICRTLSDRNSSGANDNTMAPCTAIELMMEGDIVQVLYAFGTDDTPVLSDTLAYNMFSGFRIAPE